MAEQVLDLTRAAYLVYPDHRLATVGNMRGVADDLYHLAGFCDYLLGSVGASKAESGELRLLAVVESIGQRVEELAREVEAAVEAEESADSPAN